MATKKKSESPKLTEMLDKVHEEARFIERYAEYMSMHNMGQDPSEQDWGYFMMEEESAQCMLAEKRGWTRVAKPIVKEMKKHGISFTIRDAEEIYRSDPVKWGKPYARK